MITTAMLFTDGASRGNPGPAAVAYRIVDVDGALLEARVERIPNATNNEAEYAALTAGLEACRRLGIQAVRAVSDSELMVRQMDGSYRAKEPRLAKLRDDVRELIARDFLDVRLEHRPRTDPDIATCDRMADELLTADGFPKEPPDYRRFPSAPNVGVGAALKRRARKRRTVACLGGTGQHWLSLVSAGKPPSSSCAT